MIAFIIGIHVTICVLLIIVILIQAGRGGGLVEGFSGVESMFGTKTNALLTRTTTVLSILFFLTCLSLALVSIRQSKSLMRSVKPQAPAAQAAAAQAQVPADKPTTEVPAAAPVSPAQDTSAAQPAPQGAANQEK